MARRLARLTGVVLLGLPGVLLFGPAVSAEAAALNKSQPSVLQTAWFWQTAYQQTNPPIAEHPPATEPSGVPKGDIAVAHTSNDANSSKMSALAFGIGTLKPGTLISEFTVSLTLDTSTEAGNANASGAPVVACLPTRLWTPGEAVDYTQEPPTDCTNKVKPEVKGDTWTFDITSIAQQWVDDQNLGVAFVNDPGNTQTPFQTVFKGAKDIKATMSYSPPIVVPPTGTSTGGTTTTGTGAGSDTGSTGTSGGSTAPTGAVPPASAPVDLPPSGPTTGTTTPGGQEPQVADPSDAATTPLAQAKAAPSSPNTGFWLGGVAIAALLITAAFVLRDPAVPVPNANTTRLSRVLKERERQRELAPRLV